ncbi:hypothetical protein [Streptococcus parauberis]|uniref:hypothetical protein n=1 Tax=Streptococcus parauberis TaxID=1348 RepID=UPI000C38B35E|nr:hypothetical protein [Streptococcus parauberis]PIA83756.1 hypothetical protein ADO07_01625 [Streptococcus parauberis]
MDRKTPKADKFLKDLRLIPKMIETLERDGNILSKSLIKSPQWHENSIKDGTKKLKKTETLKRLIGWNTTRNRLRNLSLNESR